MGKLIRKWESPVLVPRPRSVRGRGCNPLGIATGHQIPDWCSCRWSKALLCARVPPAQSTKGIFTASSATSLRAHPLMTFPGGSAQLTESASCTRAPAPGSEEEGRGLSCRDSCRGGPHTPGHPAGCCGRQHSLKWAENATVWSAALTKCPLHWGPRLSCMRPVAPDNTPDFTVPALTLREHLQPGLDPFLFVCFSLLILYWRIAD